MYYYECLAGVNPVLEPLLFFNKRSVFKMQEKDATDEKPTLKYQSYLHDGIVAYAIRLSLFPKPPLSTNNHLQ